MSGVRSTHFWRFHQKCISQLCRNVPAETHVDFEQPIYLAKARLGDLLFRSVLSNADTPEPSQPTLECLQVAS